MEKVIYPLPEPIKSENETFYDRDVALVLGKVSDICEKRGIAFVAATEFDPGRTGIIGHLPGEPSVAMAMLTKCIEAGEDFDTFAISFVAWLDDNKIDSSQSQCVQAIRAIAKQ